MRRISERCLRSYQPEENIYEKMQGIMDRNWKRIKEEELKNEK